MKRESQKVKRQPDIPSLWYGLDVSRFTPHVFSLERAMGFEPTTASLEGWNSTTELRPPFSSSVLGSSWFRLYTLTQHTPASFCGGQARIRTLEADGNRFTVCPLWPLGYLPETPCMRHNKKSESLHHCFPLHPDDEKKKSKPVHARIPSVITKDEHDELWTQTCL